MKRKSGEKERTNQSHCHHRQRKTLDFLARIFNMVRFFLFVEAVFGPYHNLLKVHFSLMVSCSMTFVTGSSFTIHCADINNKLNSYSSSVYSNQSHCLRGCRLGIMLRVVIPPAEIMEVITPTILTMRMRRVTVKRPHSARLNGKLNLLNYM